MLSDIKRNMVTSRRQRANRKKESINDSANRPSISLADIAKNIQQNIEDAQEFHSDDEGETEDKKHTPVIQLDDAEASVKNEVMFDLNTAPNQLRSMT